MKDQRLQVFRGAVEGLVESLEAMIRLSRWSGTEAKPEPLVAAAGKLIDRLGAADRLSSAKFHGPPMDANKVASMCAAMKRLDAAYLAYRQQTKGPQATAESTADATTALEVEIAAATTGSAAWR